VSSNFSLLIASQIISEVKRLQKDFCKKLANCSIFIGHLIASTSGIENQKLFQQALRSGNEMRQLRRVP
jgi:hypothetical protein|tara:strand:- start:290 stop:496 length:207 start_codon:yes stop_codon:yes gene_type:complete